MNAAIKSIGVLIDELITANLRCWHAQETVMASRKPSKVAKAAKQAQKLNAQRVALMRAIDERLNGATSIVKKTYE